jgi:1,4-dihydroxy-2-naphthoate octaprenyltransferase
MTETIQKSSGSMKAYWTALRAYSFPASIVPVIYGAVLAVILNPGLKFNILFFAFTLIGCMSVHIVANLINDIFDYKKGVDKKDNEIGVPHGGSHVLSEGLLTIKQMWIETIIFLFIAVACGVYLYFQIGNWVLYLSLAGLFMSVFYTASPVQFKYKALGDIGVFLGFGTGMTLGSYIVQTGQFSWIPVIVSIPFGLLIVAILHANNIRDMKFDNMFGIKTLPIIIGEKPSKYFYNFTILGAYASIVFFVIFGLLPYFALLNFITLPIAIKLIKMLNHVPTEPMAKFEWGTKHNVMTAQFNMQFGLALIAGLIIAKLFFM